MKKLTLFVLSLGLMFGAMAQNFGTVRSVVSADRTPVKPIMLTQGNVNAKTATVSDVEWFINDQYQDFEVNYNITVDQDCQVATGIFLAGDVDGLAEYNNMTAEEVVYAFATQYASYGYNFVSEVQAGTYQCNAYCEMFLSSYSLAPSTDYEIVVLEIVGQEMTLTRHEVTSESLGGNGTAVATITLSNIDSYKADIDVEVNDQTNYFFFLFGETDQLEGYEMNDLAELCESQYFTKYIADLSGYLGDEDPDGENALQPATSYTAVAIPFNANKVMGTCDSKTFTTTNTVSLNDIESVSVSVYPNPASEYVTISSMNTINTVELYNTLGQVVYSDNTIANGYNVPVSNLAKGTYFVKVYTNNGVSTEKVVVR
ncbi:MAG: T9SS type A sorting domain-containing protein [Bacteroidales bacterium]|nr:T9SS type A sorting domain-containing protein [Bacteroidales bacterium]